MATRKPRSDSAAAAVKAMVGAALPLPTTPSCVRVREADIPFLECVLRSRTRDEWSECDMIVAVQLARAQADIEFESHALGLEGSVLTNDRGTRVMNPRHTVLEQLARREMAMMKSLSMMGAVVKGDKRDLANNRTLQRQSERVKTELEDDGLLA
jgi:hypothetical protein